MIGLEVDFYSPNSFTLHFSDKYSSSDNAFKLVDLLDQSISMGKTLNSNKMTYSAFVNSGASTQVKEFMDSALDVAKNAILSTNGQGVSWDKTGLHFRKYKPNGSYEDEQIWAINNSIVFTDDNWETVKMAVGKIFDENLKTEDNPYGTAYGIVAPYIVGTLIAGQNLIIESTKPDGENMSFKVDGNGASLYNASFILSDGARQIVLDPYLGFGIGQGEIIALDDDGNKIWNEKGSNQGKANFWVDADGNVYIKGTLKGCDGTFSGDISAATGTFGGSLNVNNNFIVDANGNLTAKSGTFSGTLNSCDGTFSGVIQASQYLDSSGNDMFEDEQFKGDYLNLKGIKVTDSKNQITFEVDETGNISMKGTLKGCDGTFSGSLYSPQIYTEDFHIYPPEDNDNNKPSKFTLHGKWGLDNENGKDLALFELSYFEGDAPWVVFNSPCSAYASWNFNCTEVTGDTFKFKGRVVDFTGTEVKGVTAVFA